MPLLNLTDDVIQSLIVFSKKFDHPYTCGILCQAIAAWDDRYESVLCMYKDSGFHAYLRFGEDTIDPTYGQFAYGRDVPDHLLFQRFHQLPPEYFPDTKYDGNFYPVPVYSHCKALADGDFDVYLDLLAKSNDYYILIWKPKATDLEIIKETLPP